MRGQIFRGLLLWSALSLFILPPLIALATAIPFALSNAKRGGSFLAALIVLARTELEFYALPLFLLILAPLVIHGFVTLLWSRWDGWLTVLLGLPAVSVLLVWLCWIYANLFSQSQGVEIAELVVLSIVIPRLLVPRLRPGRLSFLQTAPAR